MKYLNLLCLLAISFMSMHCNDKTERLDARVNKCLENSSQLKFEIVGSDETGFSHNVDSQCIIGSRLPIFERSDLNSEPIKTRDLKGKINVIKSML